jgi:hypothetical protein
VAAALVILLASGGCSLLYVPKPNAARPTECTTSKGMPRADILLGATYILPAMILTIFVVPHNTCINDDCTHHEGNHDLIAPLSLIGGLIVTHFVSAKVGYDRVGECERLQVQAQPPPYYTAPPYGAPPGAPPTGPAPTGPAPTNPY